MIDAMSILSDDPRVSATLAIVALGREHAELTKLALGPILPNVDATIVTVLEPIIRDIEALGSFDPDAALSAARHIYGVLRPTLDDVAQFRGDLLSQARSIVRAALVNLDESLVRS